jgi:hypothetical protein
MMDKVQKFSSVTNMLSPAPVTEITEVKGKFVPVLN